MQLSDIDIKKALQTGDVLISDFDPTRLQPASYDVLLGYEFMIFDTHKIGIIDPKSPVASTMRKIVLDSDDDFFILHPSEFALGVTLDKIGVSEKYACQVMGKSSLARLGLIIHTTAGFIDPGNNLNITLEFVNANTVPIKLYPGMKIGQVAFYRLMTPAEKAYGHKSLNSKYFQSTGVEASAMWKNWTSENEEKYSKVSVEQPMVQIRKNAMPKNKVLNNESEQGQARFGEEEILF